VPAFTRSYGLGVIVHRSGKRTTVGHTGSFYGVSSRLDMTPESGTVVVVLSNFDGAGAAGIADFIAELLAAGEH